MVRNMYVNTVEIGYNVMGTEYYMPLYLNIVLTEEYNLMFFFDRAS